MFGSKPAAMPALPTEPQDTRMSIGLWGAIGSGKTTYVTMLYDHIESLCRPDLKIHEVVTPEAVWSMGIGSNIIQMKRRRKWLAPTSPDPSSIKTYSFLIERNFERSNNNKPAGWQQLTLLFTDAGGEWYRNPEQMITNYADKYKNTPNPLERLAASRGIICLFDGRVGLGKLPWSEGDDGYRMFDRAAAQEVQVPIADEAVDQFRGLIRWLRLKSGHDHITQSLAITVTKGDTPGVWEYRKSPEMIRKWLDEWFPGVGAIVHNNCDPSKVNYFMVSTVGTTGDESNTDAQNRIRPDVPLNPYRLYQPVGWLASQVFTEPRWQTESDGSSV